MILLYPDLECKGRCGGKTEHKRTGRIVGEVDRVQYTCQLCGRVSEHSEKALTAQADDEQHASLLATIAAVDKSKAQENAAQKHAPPAFDYDAWAATNLAGTAETKARWLDAIMGDNAARRDALLRLAARLRRGDIHV